MRPLEPGLRVVTLLTTDAVSSTEQQLRLGDHRSDELRRERDDLVAREVARWHGHVIKSMGDGTLAAFAAPSEALSCSIAIQRALARRNPTATEPIALRIGMATGEVIIEGGDTFGRAAIESTRITALAESDEILCCALTRQLAAPRSNWPIESGGEVRLKGFDTPTPIFRVRWAEVHEPVAPLPPAIAARRQPFVGRGSVLAAAVDLWGATLATQRPHVFVLGGEPGVGKSSVLFRLADHAFRDGATVLYGRSTESHVDSLRPIREALGHYVTARGIAVAGELGPGKAHLVRLLPELADVADVAGAPGPGTDRDGGDHRAVTASLFDALVQFLARASQVRPVLLILDDGEWLDHQTAELLRRLTEETELGPLLTAVGHRDREPRSTGELLRTLSTLDSTRSSVHTVRLTGLSHDESAELVEIVRPSGAPLTERLHRDSGGNPLYLLELLRAVQQVDTRVELDQLPKDVVELVLRRVDRLAPRSVELLEASAVLGQEFDGATVEQMLGWPVDDIYKELDGLIRNELLRESPGPDVRFEFSHAIVREAVYARLTRVLRVRQHRRAAETLANMAIAGRSVPARDVAHHYLQAAPGGVLEPALAWCRRAANEGSSVLAFEETGRWLDAALSLCDQIHAGPTDEHLALQLERAVASQRAGERGTRARFQRAAQSARALGDPDGLVQVALASDRGFFAMLGRADDDRIEMLREAIPLAASPGDRACLLALLASELTWDDPQEARFALSDEALGLARASGDRTSLIRVLSLRAPTIWAADTREDVVATIAELGELPEVRDDPLREGRYLTFRFGVDAEAGEFHGLAALVERLGELGWFLRLPVALWHAALLRANLALLDGRLDDARSCAQESLDWGQRARQPEAMLFAAAVDLEVRRLRGDLDEMLPALEMARAESAIGGFSATRYLYEAGHATAAREDYARAVRNARLVPRAVHGGSTMTNLAYLASRFEDIPTARRLATVLEPYTDRFFQAIATLHVTDHYRGLLAATTGDYAAAEHLLRCAVDKEDKGGAHLLAAESRVEWARLALVDEDWSGPSPRAVVDMAVATAEASGASALVARGLELRVRL